MRFEEIQGRFARRRLSCEEAASMLGVSVSTFGRWRRRYEAAGAEGLYDRRLGKVSARRAPVDEVARVLELFETRYFDFTVKHFHEKLASEHGSRRSYSWTKNTLQAAGKVKKAKKRGAHRRKRVRKPLPGMMLFQDASPHRWIPGSDQDFDLEVTLDDATSEVYSAFLVEEEGTMSSLAGLHEVIAQRGLFCSLYTDRASQYFHTPNAGGRVDKQTPTQVGRALAQLGIKHIPSYSPEARGRMERFFGTLQKRLPQELRLAGITDLEAANRFIRETFLPACNARFAVPPAEPGTAFVPYSRDGLADVLCVQEERLVGNDNTVHYRGKVLQIPADRHRHHYVKATVRVHEYTDGTLAVFYGPRRLARYHADGALRAEHARSAA